MPTPHARLSLVAVLALSACATAPKAPEDAIGNAANAVASAEDQRASDYASAEMHSAHQKLDAARALARQASPDKDDPNATKARWLAEEASADAALAEAKAREVRTLGVLRQLQGAAPPPVPTPVPAPAASTPANGN